MVFIFVTSIIEKEGKYWFRIFGFIIEYLGANYGFLSLFRDFGLIVI